MADLSGHEVIERRAVLYWSRTKFRLLMWHILRSEPASQTQTKVYATPRTNLQKEDLKLCFRLIFGRSQNLFLESLNVTSGESYLEVI
jgi:hypothetical protein